MKLPKKIKTAVILLVTQLILWPVLIATFYHSGNTPYWFDNRVQSQSWGFLLGSKTYSAVQKHNPYQDPRFNSLNHAHQVTTSEGTLAHRSTNDSGETWVIRTRGHIEQLPIIIAGDKTTVTCGTEKENQIRKLFCLDLDDCPTQLYKDCGQNNLEKLSYISLSDSVIVQNVYNLDEYGNPIHHYTSHIYLK